MLFLHRGGAVRRSFLLGSSEARNSGTWEKKGERGFFPTGRADVLYGAAGEEHFNAMSRDILYGEREKMEKIF